jgi:cyclopropane fatty-acyl-phospholipid synthase-like methyltransferase
MRCDRSERAKHRTGAESALAAACGIGHTRAMDDKPFAPACERNRDPILAVLRAHFSDRTRVLEIGSGTGQHAVHFAAALPNLEWQTSDRSENLPGIRLWLDEAKLPNTPPPIELDVATGRWPGARYDAVFSANTLHIMSWPEVEALFKALPSITTTDAKLAIYGPFNFDGQYTSPSNAAFDESLKARVSHMGLRDMQAVNALARAAAFALIDDVPMPANNRTLVWQRQEEE